MTARHYLLAGAVLGAALIGGPSLGFVAYSAGYQAGAEAEAMNVASAVAPPQPAARTTGVCSIPNISAMCDVDAEPEARTPITPPQPVATSGVCAIPNISNLCPVR